MRNEAAIEYSEALEALRAAEAAAQKARADVQAIGRKKRLIAGADSFNVSTASGKIFGAQARPDGTIETEGDLDPEFVYLFRQWLSGELE